MKILIVHMVAIALLTVVPGNPSECCRVQSWFEQPGDVTESSSKSCCHSPAEVAATSTCCEPSGSEHRQPGHAPCDCCVDLPEQLASNATSSSKIDLNPDVSFIDQVVLPDDHFGRSIARAATVDESPPIAFTELYCVRRE